MKQKLFKIAILASLLFGSVTAFAQAIPKWKVGDLKNLVADTSGPLIINMWSTTCVPCIKELPFFQQTATKYAGDGVKLYLVSIDMNEHFPKRVTDFVKKLKITSPVVFLDETNADVFCPALDESWSGAIPATLLIDNKKGYRKFFESELSLKQLEEEVQKMLQYKQ